MTTISIKWDAPDSLLYDDSMLTPPNPITKANVSAASMVESRSGPIDDYYWKYNAAISILCVTAKQSCRDRFRAQKTELDELQDKITKLEQSSADRFAKLEQSTRTGSQNLTKRMRMLPLL
jgi:hypothetical protein